MDRGKLLLTIPPKKPYEIDIVKPLANLFSSLYSSSSEKVKKVNEAAVVFGKLRSESISKVFEKSETSLQLLYVYYDQICALESKISVQELQIPFKYKDAFDKGSFFGNKASLTLCSLAYEKTCTLFNVAALQSIVAQKQNFDSDEGLQQAVKLLQQASGIFFHLKTASVAAIPTQSTPDLSSDCLNILGNLMLAQAQEVFLVKLIKDNGKELLIAKICCQCEDMYADILKNMQKENLRSLWEKEWIPNVAGKQAGFHAMVYLYMSLYNRTCKQIGQEISRLQKALELFRAAQQRSGNQNLFEGFLNKAERHLIESKKDNDFIYNEQIPDVNALENPGKLMLAKPIAIALPMSKDFKDVFHDMVPVALHHALVTSETRKNDAVNLEIIKLRDATHTLNEILSSMNLPAAIEDTEKGNSLPPSLIEKANLLRANGGVTSIRSYITELPNALERNQQILDETERMLEEEKNSDTQLRNQFKEKWNRAVSEKLTENFRSSASKYREIINNATTADKIIRDKFEKNAHSMEILCQSDIALHYALPAATGGNAALCPSSKVLKELIKMVEVLKSNRDTLETEIKSMKIDLTDMFLKALAEDGAIDEVNISVGEIGRCLNPYQKRVQLSLQEQENVVSKIQEAHKQFIQESGLGANTRDSLLKELATAYDVFVELQNNLKEGTKFYNDLTELLIVFQNKISDFCYARKTEKDELLKDLTSSSSRQTMPATPAIPTHHLNFQDNVSPTSFTQSAGSSSYPIHSSMPIPYGATPQTPYPTYMPLPMPQGFNPYATLPYPNVYQFPQSPQNAYGTWPGTQSGYPEKRE